MSGLLEPSAIVNNSLANPFGTGLENGAAIGQMLTAKDREAQREADLAALAEKHDPKAILAMSLKYPELSAHIKTAFEGMDQAEQKRRVEETIPVYSAALAGRMDVAKKMLERKALALENSNGSPEEIQKLRDMAQLATDDPESFKNYAGQSLAIGQGADNYGKTWVDLGKAENDRALSPYQKYSEAAKGAKDQAEADTKREVLPFAAPAAAAKLAIDRLTPSDMLADNANNAGQTAANVEKNKLQQKELNQNMLIKGREQTLKQIDNSRQYDSAINDIVQIKDRIGEALNNPVLKQNAWQRGTFQKFPGSPQFAFEKEVGTIQIKNLIPTLQAAKAAGWTGSMSDKDMEMLKSEIDSISTSLDSKSLQSHLKKINDVLNVALVRGKKYGKKIEDAGGMLPGTIEDVDSQYAKKTPAEILKGVGASDEEIQQYLQSKGQ